MWQCLLHLTQYREFTEYKLGLGGGGWSSNRQNYQQNSNTSLMWQHLVIRQKKMWKLKKNAVSG
jgi:hypothetical protein